MDLLRLRSDSLAAHTDLRCLLREESKTQTYNPIHIKFLKDVLLSSTQIMFNSQVHEGKHYRIDSPESLKKIF